MRTALLSAREFTVGDASADSPAMQPDDDIDSLLDVLDIVVHSRTSQQCA